MKKIVLFLIFFFLYPLCFADESAATIYVIPIHGDIDKSMTVFIRRGIEKAKSDGAGYIIFDINTYGGLVDSALQITTLIGSLNDITTIAYVTVHPESTGVSWSAGALISFSCNKIFMAPGTSIGAAAPVYQGSEGMEMAPEKVVSAVRAQIAALAEKNGYPENVALAMVDEDIELYEVYVDGELRLLTSGELRNLQNELAGTDTELKKGDLISPSGKLLTLTAGKMEKYGVSSGTPPTLEDLLGMIGEAGAKVIEVSPDVFDDIVTFITSAAITGILITIAIIALYLEISSPGFGIPGTVAIIAFSIVFLSNFLLGNVGSLELIIFLIGVVLLVVELFLIPGFGVTGISGIILILLSLTLSMQEFAIPQFDWQWDIFLENIITVVMSLFASIFFLAVLARYMPLIGPFRRLALTTEETREKGYTVQPLSVRDKYINKKGISITTLRPSGKAEIEGDILSVEADGEFIEKGTEIKVVEVTGNKIVVRKS